MKKSTHKVKLEHFEGPLDLLLHLIKKEELDIYDISIERLTLQYMDYLDSHEQLNIPLASEFMVMASNLMYIKSKALLPKRDQSVEESPEEDDPRWDLIRQLLEYKKFKEAALNLQERQARQTNIFAKQISLDTTHNTPDNLPEEASIYELVKAFQSVLKRYKEEHEEGEIINDAYNVSQKIESLMETFSKKSTSPFLDLFHENTSKQEIIVTFLAILELIKLRKLGLRQTNILEEIIIFAL